MSHLNFTAYQGYGQWAQKNMKYSQGVKVGDIVYLSGQGGWSRELPRVYGATQEEQIDQTFKNVTHALQETGAAPEHIFRTVIYHRPMSQSALDAVIRNLKELAPNHEPLWTAIEVTRLAVDEMLIEMDVQAHVPSKV